MFHSAPVSGTNLLLLNDIKPDCVCEPGGAGGGLEAVSERNIFNVTFGNLSYKPLPCTNNINISTECSGGCGVVVSVVLVAVAGFWSFVLTEFRF